MLSMKKLNENSEIQKKKAKEIRSIKILISKKTMITLQKYVCVCANLIKMEAVQFAVVVVVVANKLASIRQLSMSQFFGILVTQAISVLRPGWVYFKLKIQIARQKSTKRE